jgi:cell division protein FtsN
VTTSSPESEPHVEHTITANGIRHGHTGGLVLSQLHIGLAVGFAIVACLTAFGGGMIVGMWYKASEQSSPLSTAGTSAPEQPAPSQETASQPQEPPAPVTFYNTLTNSHMAYAPLTPPAPGGPAGHAKGAAAPTPVAAPTSGAKAAAAGPTSAREAATVTAADSEKAVTASKVSPAAGGTTRTAAGREAQKLTKATPPPKAAPAETEPSAGGTQTAAQKPAGKGTEARRPAAAPAAAPAKAPATEDFSVQVGSFGSSEQAERLRTNLTQKGYPARVQLSSVPGQGLRYRVRVGNYSERTAADQTAHHLTAQEQVPAIVAGKD